MTSKEALKIIKTYNYWKGAEDYIGMICTHPDYIEAKKHYEEAIDNIDQIEKDLEVLEELKRLINGLEYTFNRPGVSSDTDILGTFMRDYFINNSKAVEEWLNDK